MPTGKQITSQNEDPAGWLQALKNVFRTSWSAESDETQNNAKTLLELHLSIGDGIPHWE